jgi:hypothetical protein
MLIFVFNIEIPSLINSSKFLSIIIKIFYHIKTFLQKSKKKKIINNAFFKTPSISWNYFYDGYDGTSFGIFDFDLFVFFNLWQYFSSTDG